jgi:deoxyadenosine/deoxycytidine kinase
MATSNEKAPEGLVSRPMLIHIEGNIGAGKTTLLESLMGNRKFDIVEEPIRLWTDFFGHDILNLKYNCKENAMQLIFQIVANLSRIEQLSELKSKEDEENLDPQLFPQNCKGIKIMERSLHSAFNVFTKVQRRNGELHDLDYTVLNYMYRVFNSGAMGEMCKPDLIMYLRTTPEKCMERIRKRDRPEEHGITLTYITQLHNAHEIWLGKRKDGKYGGWDAPCPIVYLDGDVEYGDDECKRTSPLIHQVYKEIKKLIRGKDQLVKLTGVH